MAAGNNDFLLWTNLGGAGVANGDPANSVGTFVFDPSTAAGVLTVNEGAGSPSSDTRFDDTVTGSGIISSSDDQHIVGGTYDGMETTAVHKATIINSNGALVGYIHTITADLDGDGNPHESGEYIGYAISIRSGRTLTPGETYTSGSGNLTDGGFTYERAVICFARGTMIETKDGQMAVEDLAQDDMVLTADNRYQPVRWIGSRTLSSGALAVNDKNRPIRIRAGALGQGLPKTNLLVSPQHRMLVSSKIAKRMFDEKEVLISAKHLLGIDGVEVAQDIEAVQYFHILFDQHEIIFANGAASESLFTGPEALKAVDAASREEIFAILPQLRDIDYTSLSARPIPNGRQGRQLTKRHQKNDVNLVSGDGIVKLSAFPGIESQAAFNSRVISSQIQWDRLESDGRQRLKVYGGADGRCFGPDHERKEIAGLVSAI